MSEELSYAPSVWFPIYFSLFLGYCVTIFAKFLEKKCPPTSHQPLEQILTSILTILLELRRWIGLTIPLGF